MTEVAEYFAFGANMASRVLVGRRRIVPLASRAASVRGYALRFCLRGVPGLEPAFASLVADEEARVHGVLHRLRVDDLARLDAIERSYRRIGVLADTPDGPVPATAYVARNPSAERVPSQRYLRLIMEGAREHGLPAPYIASLEAIDGRHIPLISQGIERVIETGERLLHRFRR